MGLCALAVDISWYWVNNLRMQRAADVAALAGVVHLPGNVSLATSLALDEATKNGYTNGVGGVVVTPTQDPTNPRRLRVAISGPVSTYFARVFGIASFPARRDAKAEFVLPVPMGSPQNYYGVGFFEGIGAGPVQTVGPNLPTATAAPNGWTNANRAFTSNNQYATNATGAMQGYGTFGLSVPSGNNVLGIEVRVEARSNDATGCRLAVSLSWNNGTSWTSEKFYNLTGSDPSPPVTLGGAADTWGRTWAPTEFANGSFLVRVRDDDPGAACTNTATSSLDALDVRVSYQNPVGGGNQVFPIPDPGGGPALAPQNFWGAVFTSGGIRENGDRTPRPTSATGPAEAKVIPTQTTTPTAMTTPSSSRAGPRTARSSCSIRCSARPAATATAARTVPATTGPAIPDRTRCFRSMSATGCTT